MRHCVDVKFSSATFLLACYQAFVEHHLKLCRVLRRFEPVNFVSIILDWFTQNEIGTTDEVKKSQHRGTKISPQLHTPNSMVVTVSRTLSVHKHGQRKSPQMFTWKAAQPKTQSKQL